MPQADQVITQTADTVPPLTWKLFAAAGSSVTTHPVGPPRSGLLCLTKPFAVGSLTKGRLKPPPVT